MKLLSLILAVSAFASFAQAADLVCASKKGETIYYTEGQLVLKAKIAGLTKLKDLEFAVLPVDKLGGTEKNVIGSERNGWVRFTISGDAWCSYRLAIPRNFKSQGSFVGFLDAFCEENSNSSHRLSCSVR